MAFLRSLKNTIVKSTKTLLPSQGFFSFAPKMPNFSRGSASIYLSMFTALSQIMPASGRIVYPSIFGINLKFNYDDTKFSNVLEGLQSAGFTVSLTEPAGIAFDYVKSIDCCTTSISNGQQWMYDLYIQHGQQMIDDIQNALNNGLMPSCDDYWANVLSGGNSGAVVGGVIGGVFGLAALAGIIAWITCCVRDCNQRNFGSAPSVSAPEVKIAVSEVQIPSIAPSSAKP